MGRSQIVFDPTVIDVARTSRGSIVWHTSGRVRPMPYARCSECGQTMEVEKVSNDVMMMWHGTHCGSLRTYFADKDILETACDLEKKSASKNQDGGKPF